MAIEPQKANRGTDQRKDHRRDFAGIRIVLYVEITRGFGVAGDIAEYPVGQSGAHRAPACQPVQPIGEIHRIGTADDHGPEKNHRQPSHVQNLEQLLLDERQLQVSEIFLLPWQVIQRVARRESDRPLDDQLAARIDAARVLLRHLEIVIHPAKCPQPHRNKEHNPHKRIVEPAAAQHCDQQAADDEHSAHGGRARFLPVQFK